MAHRNFIKSDFIIDESSNLYQVEFRKRNIGEGSNLIVERETGDGSYETIQTQIKRHNDSIFICWSEPFNGRLIFEE